MSLMTYIGIVGVVLSHERTKLLHYSMELEKAYAEENALAKASYAVSHSMLKWQEKFFSLNLAPAFEEQIALDVELAQAGITGLTESYPQLAADIAHLNRDVERLRVEPTRSSMIWLRDHGRALSDHLDQVTRQVRMHRSILWDRYRNVYDSMTLIAVIMGLMGAVFFGALMTLFLTRLAWDIKRLAERSLEIVSGYRGPAVPVTRDDEVGDLMEAVNRMQHELRAREQQLEVSREQHFHKEKMAAIGSLAAAVAHEINNPIAAIAGIAQTMKDSESDQPAGGSGSSASDMILEQAKRITSISRQIAELTAPHPPTPELLDLNALVRNTCRFITYDKRFRAVEMILELDSQIPALEAVADHLTQVLMNLLINAADALEGITTRKPAIYVETHVTESGVLLVVKDNGKGMDTDVLAHVFEESFTTKPPDRGRGLGLFLCKSLIEGSGNRIEMESTPGFGTIARIHLTLANHTGA
ncbi:MAG: HAMP domain-containing protein [Betaproteobacteria bacterium]|nr:HAMP domain-containing protein [Betaproteobacteria bacterium]